MMHTLTENAQDRMFNLLSLINLISALLVSGVVGPVLQPMVISNLPETMQTVGHAYNLVMTVFVTLGGNIMAYSGFCAMCLCAQPDSLMARLISHAGSLVIYQFGSLLLVYLFFALMCLAAYISNADAHSSETMLNIGIVVVTSLLFFGHTCHLFCKLFPVNMLPWISCMAPWMLLPCCSTIKEDAERVGKLLVDEAFRHGELSRFSREVLHEDIRPLITKDGDTLNWEELNVLLTQTFPTISPGRHDSLLTHFLNEGMTVTVLRKTAEVPNGGPKLLFDVLQAQGLELAQGEILMLIAAVTSNV